MADIKCNYVLKGKYNGVYGYTNATLTDKQAEELAKKHRRGLDLFSVLPSAIQKIIDKEIVLKAKKDEEAIIEMEAEAEAYKEKHDKKRKADSAKRDALKESQREAEAEAKKNALEQEEKGRNIARLNDLLSWTKERLEKKAKKLKLTVTGSVEDLAKRIHKKEQ